MRLLESTAPVAGQHSGMHCDAGWLLLQATGKFEPMMPMVDVLLELGRERSRVNVVGNDLVATASGACGARSAEKRPCWPGAPPSTLAGWHCSSLPPG